MNNIGNLDEWKNAFPEDEWQKLVQNYSLEIEKEKIRRLERRAIATRIKGKVAICPRAPLMGIRPNMNDNI